MTLSPTQHERLDAFVSRFGRLQDNLDKAERLGWIESAQTWLEIRKLRNQMVHEYIEDLVILCDSIKAGHAFVSTLVKTADQFVAQADTRIAASLIK